MNDAERDAWLREALRHAPDSEALPPRGVSEAILAKARAAARPQRAAPARATRTNPLAAFWDWIARPPVAAGFATVMAATLVGLMWWDRPMDETLPRRPDATSERARAPVQDQGTAPALKTPAPLAKNKESTSAARSAPAAPEPSPARARSALGDAAQPQREAPAGERARAADDKVARSSPAENRKLADAVAPGNAERAERKVQAPSPFPGAESERSAQAAKPAPTAKKDEASAPDASAEARAPADATVAQSGVAAAPAAPQAGARLRAQPAPTPPVESRRADADDARTSAANAPSLDAGKSAAAPTTAAAPAAVPAPAARSGARDELREQQASAFGSAPAAAARPPAGLAEPAAPMRNEVAAGQRQSTLAAAPLAPVLTAIASDPARWSRASATGNVVALDPAWREWLGQVDSAAAGRWNAPMRASAGADNEQRAGTTTLRLVTGGRPTVMLQLDGTTVRLDGAMPGERWQASLPAEAAERLRAAAARLPP